MQLDPISINEAARYMGIKNVPDKTILELLEKTERIVREKITPKYVYRETKLRFENGGVYLVDCGNLLLRGKDITNHLESCTKAVILAATLTSEADKLIRRTEIIDMAEALVVDCLCSAAIEQACQQAEEEIFSNYGKHYRTWRFSPGYGDLPLEHQKDFISILNAQRRIGLTVNDCCMLLPSKSVTAIIGISDVFQRNKLKGCKICNMRGKCAFSGNGGCGIK